MAAANAVSENQILAALPRREFERLRERLDLIELGFGDVLMRQNEPIQYVYFPRTGIVSLVATMPNQDTVEVGMVGREGMAGLSVFLGGEQAMLRVLVRAPGEAWRLSSRAFKEVCREGGQLPELLARYAQALLALVSQSAACNLLHSAEARLRRWLLMAHDRMASDEFYVTQEFIAGLLGVSRPTVSIVASSIQRAGHIQYRRGKVRILDRQGLEMQSCPCYNLICKEYGRLLRSSGSRSRLRR